MEDLLNQLMEFFNRYEILSAFLSPLIILFESIIPIIPLMVFITINFKVYGTLFGFLVSWIFTILGCILSYLIFKRGYSSKFELKTKHKKNINKFKKMFKNISLGKLTILIAIPFTPAFAVNISAGLAKMDFKKFLVALLIGKIALVYFWGFIGVSFIDSINNPKVLAQIVLLVLTTYLISAVLNKKLNIK